jgi:hypothetical protein
VGLFSKKPKISVCEMCDKADLEGCGSVHNHVEQISGNEPAWLPGNLRAQAQGEYTWLCVRCDSYPAMKWPSNGGAWAGMMLHLGSAHYVGQMKGMGRTDFSMISTAH